jgi:hypothetical protein
LHSIWSTLEANATPLDRLCRQQAQVVFDLVEGPGGTGLSMTIKLAEAGGAIRVVLDHKETRYYLLRGGEMLAVDPPASQVDRGVYLLLAELAG